MGESGSGCAFTLGGKVVKRGVIPGRTGSWEPSPARMRKLPGATRTANNCDNGNPARARGPGAEVGRRELPKRTLGQAEGKNKRWKRPKWEKLTPCWGRIGERSTLSLAGGCQGSGILVSLQRPFSQDHLPVWALGMDSEAPLLRPPDLSALVRAACPALPPGTAGTSQDRDQ